MPLQATSGAASYDAFGGGVPVVPAYIEDVFSTYLYTGNGSTQTITNGIDLSTKGGLVWLKGRSVSAVHTLVDTARGAGKTLFSDLTNAEATNNAVSAFNANGFTMGSYNNSSGDNYVSWTFREQPKFFDVVTFTTNSSGGATGTHSLGSTPGAVFIKNTASAEDWLVWHTSIGDNFYIVLNSPSAKAAATGWISPSSSALNIANSSLAANTAYVAYVFAHNAGGFGLTGTDNVISCGSYTATGNDTINLGYEPQWILEKRVSSSGDDWEITDNMRGFSMNDFKVLNPNTSAAETSYGAFRQPTATGYINKYWGSGTIIYIAIRRGPMKVPTSGTSVFTPVTYTGTSATRTITGVGFPLDMNITMDRATHTYNVLSDRLRGLTCDGSATQPQLRTNATDAEASIANGLNGTSSSAMDGYTLYNAYSQMNASPDTYVSYNYRRAPSFFDEVCYTGTGVQGRSVTHNLTVPPEIVIIKGRNQSGYEWVLLSTTAPAANSLFYFNTSDAGYSRTGNPDYFGNSSSVYTAPSSTIISLGSDIRVNNSGTNYVAYLFATCAGVSKVFSFTGNGTTQTINCGFTGGARFVLLKASSATGGWYVYDTARGMTVLTDPYLQLNSTAAETATLGSVTTVTTGFAVNEAITTGVNTNGVTYIGLAIA